MEVTFRLTVQDHALPPNGEVIQVPLLVNLNSEGIIGFEIVHNPTKDVVTVDIDFQNLPVWKSDA